jgi:hypothetical protein
MIASKSILRRQFIVLQWSGTYQDMRISNESALWATTKKGPACLLYQVSPQRHTENV